MVRRVVLCVVKSEGGISCIGQFVGWLGALHSHTYIIIQESVYQSGSHTNDYVTGIFR